ncbi:MAG TPA: hypothetical protein VLK84_14110, partial [Longimicrobium sp.]|nr:hypothetical protein [Longimicrobium sp.]
LPWSLGASLHGLIAVSAVVIGRGAAVLFWAQRATPAQTASMIVIAALGAGAAGAGLLRRHDRAAPGRLLLSTAAAVGICVFLLAAQWSALWILMPDAGWT